MSWSWINTQSNETTNQFSSERNEERQQQQQTKIYKKKQMISYIESHLSTYGWKFHLIVVNGFFFGALYPMICEIGESTDEIYTGENWCETVKKNQRNEEIFTCEWNSLEINAKKKLNGIIQRATKIVGIE